MKQEKIESTHLASTSQGYGTSKKKKRGTIKENKLHFLGAEETR